MVPNVPGSVVASWSSVRPSQASMTFSVAQTWCPKASTSSDPFMSAPYPTRRPFRSSIAPSDVERRESVGAQDEGHLRPVPELVLHEVPDHPATGHGTTAAAVVPHELGLEVGRRPPTHALVDRLPCRLERLHELVRRARPRLVVLPARVLEREPGDGGGGHAEAVADRM